MAKVLEYNATLLKRHNYGDALASFHIKPDAGIPEGDWFVPGQYMVVGLNNEHAPELGSVKRAMSIASAPCARKTIDFYIRYVNHPDSNNPLTHLLFKCTEGDRIFLSTKPKGRFTLKDCLNDTGGNDDPRFKIFVAAGTGLAPFLSIVEDYVAKGRSLTNCVMLHAASYSEEIGYRERLTEPRTKHGMHYYASISRPKERPDWQGDTGRVEDYFLPERLLELEARLGLGAGKLTPKKCVIFICGLTGTIGKTIERTLDRGFAPDHRKIRRALEIAEEVPAALFFEQYDTTPVLNIQDDQNRVHLRSLWQTGRAHV